MWILNILCSILVVNFAFSQVDGFEGAVKLVNCSASLFKYDGQSLDDKALILTNGHCFGRLKAKGSYQNIPYNKPVGIYKKDFSNIQWYSAEKIVYTTMDKTDIGIIKLSVTYKQIEETTGVKPFLLSNIRPGLETSIEIPSAYWRKIYKCSIDDFVPSLKEHVWQWEDSIRYTQENCQVQHGSSGSPIIEEGTRTIIGINNTINEAGTECSINNPCEVKDDGTIVTYPNTGYGQQTFQIYSCLNEDYEIDLNKEGCKLP